MERAPVVRNEVARSQPLEERQRIVAREVSTPETGLPPGSMADWKEGEVEDTILAVEDALDDMMGRRREARVPGEEARSIRCDQQVHVRGTSPVVVSIPAAAVLGRCRMNRQCAKLDRVTRIDPDGLVVACRAEPRLNGARGVDRNAFRERRQGREREMVRVGVRDENRVEIGKRVERDSWRTHAAQKSGERWIEVRIGEDPLATDFEQERRVTDVRHAQPLDGTGARAYVGRGDVVGGAAARPETGVTLARSFAISHCWGSAAMFCTV